MARTVTAPTGSKKASAPSPTKATVKGAVKAGKATPPAVAKPTPAPVKRGKAKAPALETITLRQFATAYSEEKGMKRADGIAMIEEIIAKIRTHIVNGTKVRIQGLGSFEIRDRPARMGRNPATGEAIKIAASRKLVFKPAAELKEAV